MSNGGTKGKNGERARSRRFGKGRAWGVLPQSVWPVLIEARVNPVLNGKNQSVLLTMWLPQRHRMASPVYLCSIQQARLLTVERVAAAAARLTALRDQPASSPRSES